MLITIVLSILVAWIVWVYNSFVRQGNAVKEAWSGIDVQLKRRHDLIPNLVKIVKEYVNYEQSTLEEVVLLRAQSISETNTARVEKTEVQISESLGKLIAVVEDYPEIKANESFQSLHDSLVEVEDDLQYARRYYNGTIRDFNNLIEVFPNNLLARMFNLKKRNFFGLENVFEKKSIKVSL